MGNLSKRLTSALTAVLVTVPTVSYGQSITVPIDNGQSAYTVALKYCESRQGLAQYSPKGDIVVFSCGDSPADTITISK